MVRGVSLVRVFVLAVSLSLTGCVDVNQPAVHTKNYTSPARFVNLAVNSSLAVMVDGGSAVTGIAYGNTSAYIDLPSGSRLFRFSYSSVVDTLRQSLMSQYKYSIFVVYDPSTSVTSGTYVFLMERYTFESPYPADSSLLRFVQLSPDTSATIKNGVSVTFSYGSRDTSFKKISFQGNTPYLRVPSNGVRFTVIGSNGDTLKSVSGDAGLSGLGRYSFVIYGPASSLQKKLFKED